MKHIAMNPAANDSDAVIYLESKGSVTIIL